MIIQTKTGAQILGTLSREPEIKETRSGNQFLSLSVKASSVKDESGKWNSLFVECCIWRNLEQWDGLLQKGDSIMAFGRELKSHESGGKTYWNLDADGIFPDGSVTARWIQTAIDMMQAPAMPAYAGRYRPDDFEPVDGETPFDHGSEPPQNASAPTPDKQPTPAAAPDYNGDDRPISDTDDLPF
jgi:single-stranded DNA-binding protein